LSDRGGDAGACGVGAAGNAESKDGEMKPTYDQIVKWMKDYFATYNLYAQDAATVHHMDDYFAPDLRFMPYMYVFGGPDGGHHTRQAFYDMLTTHPDDYEQFEVLDIFVDAERMVSVAFLIARIYSTKGDELLVEKHYLPLYELALDDEDKLTIKTIRFFWEASPPEVDAHYSGAQKGN
jgi:hypothetical protein